MTGSVDARRRALASAQEPTRSNPQDLTPSRQEELRKVAEAATKGPWRQHVTRSRSPEVYTDAPPPNTPNPLIAGRILRKLDAAHIATFDPPTCLSLLREIARLKEKCGE